MKNIIAGIPRGNDFFQRPKLIDRIYRRLDSGDSIYLSAPRRMGKSAIMHFLLDNPKKGFDFYYINTDGINDTGIFFKKLAELLKDNLKISDKSRELLSNFFKKINEIEIAGFKVGFNGNAAKEDFYYFDEFEKVLKNLEYEGDKIVLMIDEFPQTVENILRKNGEQSAIQFLQFNRTIRQMHNSKIQFLITGSIGLTTIALKLKKPEHINDLNFIEIPPLTPDEAREFIIGLAKTYQVEFNDEVIGYLLQKIGRFVPLYLQLAFQEVLDECENRDKKSVDLATIDAAFPRITNMRNNNYFDSFVSRLDKTFDTATNEYSFVKDILRELTEKPELEQGEIAKKAEENNLSAHYADILRTLEFDGYIISRSNGKTFYSFSSPILKTWWNRNVF